MKAALILAPLALLAACAPTPKPDVRTVEVKVPVAVACVPKGFPDAPAGLARASEAIKAARDAGDLIAALGAYVKFARQRLAEVEPVVAGCR